MNREEISVTTRTISKATHNGWELTFNHEQGNNTNSVTCNGNNGSAHLSASLNANSAPSLPPAAPSPTGGVNSHFNMHGAPHDTELASAIMNELADIIDVE